MRLGTVLTPYSETNLRLAAQCGVTDVVYRYPGPNAEDIRAAKQMMADYDLKLSVIEGYLPIENIKLGCDDGTEVEALKTLIHQMSDAEIPILCYNFMAGTDWVRTVLDAPERGGALVTGFDLSDIPQAVLLGHEDSEAVRQQEATSEQLWKRLEELLTELVPVAEKAGVSLAMHPDDPPLPAFMNKSRIMNCVENFERLVNLVPSPQNGICFCQGTFATMGVDIPATIRRLGSHIKYVHFRDVRGTPESFRETFHDNGPTNMVEAIRALREVGFNGPLRPDHVPQLVGEEDGEPGYTTLGRLYAWGYIRALMQATE